MNSHAAQAKILPAAAAGELAAKDQGIVQWIIIIVRNRRRRRAAWKRRVEEEGMTLNWRHRCCGRIYLIP